MTATAAPTISVPEPAQPVVNDPGYGEEPETAMAPTSFDNDMSGDHSQDYSNGNSEHNMAIENSAPSQEPFSLKEDG